MSTLSGGREPRERWFGGVRGGTGGSVRTRPLGMLRVTVIPAVEPYESETVGYLSGPGGGGIALSHLGPTAAERADQRARARSAVVDRALASVGIRPRRS
jgi:hypothetical protein